VASSSALRIGQFTGWHGDRGDGMAELIEDGVDVLTGDYLAELTMLVLQKNRQRGGKGYVEAFLEVLGRHLEQIARRGIKVVTNAGGLDAPGLADAVRALCAERVVELTVAAVVGDDLTETVLGDSGLDLVNIDTGQSLKLAEHRVLTANAYLGAWPIVRALELGADIVICPRMTDASLLVGPAAWQFGWTPADLDELAGAVVAGHVIECGAQATGGNFSFFTEYPDLGLPGMPIAELRPDGSAIVTKNPASGGVVTKDTVIAQLFYEIGGHHYLNPDVVVDLTSVHVEDLSDDRVRIHGTRGLAPTSTVKLSLTFEGGYRNSMTIGLTGGNLEAKRAWIQRQVEAEIGPPQSFDECRWSQIGPADPHGSFEAATAWLVLTVRDRDRERVARAAFAGRVVAIATSSVPGFYLTTPPQQARSFGVQWPTLVDKESVAAQVLMPTGLPIDVAWPSGYSHERTPPVPTPPALPWPSDEDRITVPLGSVVGTRSGDKAGSANIGAWARDEDTFGWLAQFLTVERLRELIPELADLRVVRYAFPNLLGLNFVVFGYLGDGVAACTRIDPQGKGLGEYLASRLVPLPASLAP
jgi:hypothetical protein